MPDIPPPTGRHPGYDVRVEHRASGPVVVKRAAPAQADSLRAEARLLADLAHPGLVRPVALERVGGRVQLVTSHAGSHTLDTAPPTMPSLATRQLGQLAAALAHLHQHGLAHGRLDPTHVVLASDGRATLCGLGGALAGDAAGLAADLAALRHLGCLQLDRCRLPGAGPRRRAETDLRRHLGLLLADPQLDARTLADRLASLWRSHGRRTSTQTLPAAADAPLPVHEDLASRRPAGPRTCGSANMPARRCRGWHRVRRLQALLGALAVATGAWQFAAGANGSAPSPAGADLAAAPHPPAVEGPVPGPAPPAAPLARHSAGAAPTTAPDHAARAPTCDDFEVGRCGPLDASGAVHFGGRDYRIDHGAAAPALYLIHDWDCDGSETLAVLDADRVLHIYAAWPSDADDKVVPAPRHLPTVESDIGPTPPDCEATLDDPGRRPPAPDAP